MMIFLVGFAVGWFFGMVLMAMFSSNKNSSKIMRPVNE